MKINGADQILRVSNINDKASRNLKKHTRINCRSGNSLEITDTSDFLKSGFITTAANTDE